MASSLVTYKLGLITFRWCSERFRTCRGVSVNFSSANNAQLTPTTNEGLLRISIGRLRLLWALKVSYIKPPAQARGQPHQAQRPP